MIKKILFSAGAILLWVAAPLNAQKTWSLEECILYALDNNLQVKRQELNVDYTRNKLHPEPVSIPAQP